MAGYRFRSIALRLASDDRFAELTLEAKGLLLTLVLHCSYVGLGRFQRNVLASHANTEEQRVASVLAELEAAGLVITDGKALFIVDVLAWQPSASPANPNHRPSVDEAIGSIHSPKLVQAFCERYPEWATASAMVRTEGRSTLSEDHSNGIAHGLRRGSGPSGKTRPMASRSDSDQEEAAGSEEENQKQPISSQPTNATNGSHNADSLARALAAAIDREQSRNGTNKPVRVDVGAAAELLDAGVEWQFAVDTAAAIAADFSPLEGSPQIMSTKYVTQAIIERWRLASLGSGGAPRTSVVMPRRRRSVRDEEQDQASNRDPQVHQRVQNHVGKLNDQSSGSGDKWLSEMKNLARDYGRYAFPFADEWLRANDSIPRGRTPDGDPADGPGS